MHYLFAKNGTCVKDCVVVIEYSKQLRVCVAMRKKLVVYQFRRNTLSIIVSKVCITSSLSSCLSSYFFAFHSMNSHYQKQPKPWRGLVTV